MLVIARSVTVVLSDFRDCGIPDAAGADRAFWRREANGRTSTSMSASDWIEVGGAVLLLASLVLRFRRNSRQPSPIDFSGDRVIYEERVIAKWTSPLGGWSGRIS